MHPQDEPKITPVSDGKVEAQANQLHVDETPAGAVNLNVEGRQTQSQNKGFGQLWRKTYSVELRGATVTPAEVVRLWKERLPDLQPPENRVFTTSVGVEPGEVILINAQTPGGQLETGMLVVDADRESFTLMTPQGHPEAGYITFSAFKSASGTVAQIQSVARASDPLFEFGFRLFGAKMQESIWQHVLTELAKHFSVTANVALARECVDARLQWSRWGNIRHNAQLHSLAYRISAPVRKLLGRDQKGTNDARV